MNDMNELILIAKPPLKDVYVERLLQAFTIA